MCKQSFVGFFVWLVCFGLVCCFGFGEYSEITIWFHSRISCKTEVTRYLQACEANDSLLDLFINCRE